MISIKRPSEIDTKARKKIYKFIQGMPGLHMREIQRETGIPLGTLNYHLMCLEEDEAVTSKREGKYRRYYAAGGMTAIDKKVLSVLRQKIPRRIVLYLLVNPGISRNNISEQLGISDSTTTFHLKKLINSGIVEQVRSGRESLYTVSNEEGVSRVMMAHKPKEW